MTHSDAARAPNRLAGETSPYLLQHAHNPVDWHPWGEEALAAARRDGRPILLSIGYSACHWCHVMAHESFEDRGIAEVMNELYVNIKVDREERPDLDRIYQVAHQILAQRGGGWPLTVFLTPDDLVPFFAGTYFPPAPRHGLPGFRDLLLRLAQFYHEHHDDIRRQNAALAQVFEDLVPDGRARARAQFDATPLATARAQAQQDFDADYGGFGGAPKFPHPAGLERLLRDWHATAQSEQPDLQALYMATLTLTRMAEGGVYDQLGGGFCRYSVDAYWMIPHFEKMLYDNGALLAVYAQAALATGEPLYRRIAAETAAWAIRDMQGPDGGFCAALDADSEGHEGLFYAWERAAVEALLTPGEYRVFSQRYGLDREPNFEGRYHLHVFASLEQVASCAGLSVEATTALLDSARAKLLAVRGARVRPGRDDKLITGWNGLMIRGLALAARALDRADLAAAATRAVDLLRARVWIDGRLHATFKDGRAGVPAFLDDHAFLLDGLVELLQARWRTDDLEFALDLAESLLARFEDRERGGFWFTAADQPTPLHRPKGFADDATPAGNGVAARALARVGWLVGEPRYLEAAVRTLEGGWDSLERAPQAHAAQLVALEEYLSPGEVVILRGEGAALDDWRRALNQLYAPRRQVYAIPADAVALPAALAAKAPATDVVAYVCQGPQCSAPIRSLAALIHQLRDGIETRPEDA
jgi:uncharacterized protein YyaL (SSP411 family)